MSDLIDRQKVLNTLDFADNALTDEDRTVETYKELLTECIKVLPSTENNGEWIPVSERLPKAFEIVLRTRVENGWNGTTYTIVDTGCICPVDYNIVAWMPLPEPYKKGGE